MGTDKLKHIQDYLACAGQYFQNNNLLSAKKIILEAISRFPDSPEAHFNLGLIYSKSNHFQLALTAFQQSAKFNPNHSGAQFQTGLMLMLTGRMLPAVTCFQKTLSLNPNLPEAHTALGFAYEQLGQISLAKKAFNAALKMGVNTSSIIESLYSLAQKSCDWQNTKKYEKLINQLTTKGLNEGSIIVESPFTNLTRTDNLKQNLQVTKYWSNLIENSSKNLHQPFNHTNHTAKQTIKVGYLSLDIRFHAVACQIIDLFKYHDRQKFKTFVYSYGDDDNSDIRHQIKKNCYKFYDLSGQEHYKIAKKIFSDKIDILIDLSGFTGLQKPDITAYRPAPIQINYLGFPGTSGSTYIDYIIADKTVIPPKDQPYYTEKIIYLPDCYQICSPPPVSKKTFQRSDFGLPEDAFIFSSFNRPSKIEPAMFDTWINIIKKVPQSILWLYSDNPVSKKNLTKYWANSGLDPKRLIFYSKLPLGDFITSLKLSHLHLDTSIYSGGATTANLLWAGVPVITLEGKHYLSRMTSSLLKNIGLNKLICKSLLEYENLAVYLATHPKKLQTIQKKIQNNKLTYPLFNTKLFTQNLEKALIIIYKKYFNQQIIVK